MEDRAEELNKILRADENPTEAILDLIGGLERNQREVFQKTYDQMYPDEGGLQKELDKKLKGHQAELIKRVFTPRAENGAQKLKNAFGIFSIDEEPVHEFLFNYPKWLKDEIAKKFKEITGKDLLKELEESFVDPIRDILKFFYDTDKVLDKKVDKEACKELAKEFNEEEPSKWLYNKDLMEKLSKLSPDEIVQTFREYNALNRFDILKTLKTLPDSQKKFLKDFLYYSICPPQRYAKLIHKGITEPGLSNEDVINVLANRNDVDMDLIKEFYKKKYGKELEDDIKENFDEDFVEVSKKLMK